MVALVLFSLLGFGLAAAALALAQDAPTEHMTRQLALARVCASEVGLGRAGEWRDPAGRRALECAAISAVLGGRAHRLRLSYVAMARAYSGRVFDVERTDGRGWVARLTPDGAEPRGWPDVVVVRGTAVPHAPWSTYRSRWLDLYAIAGRIVRGEISATCDPDHWGMREGIDWERATRAGWVEIDCGPAPEGSGPSSGATAPTHNAFWCVPTEEDPCPAT